MNTHHQIPMLIEDKVQQDLVDLLIQYMNELYVKYSHINDLNFILDYTLVELKKARMEKSALEIFTEKMKQWESRYEFKEQIMDQKSDFSLLNVNEPVNEYIDRVEKLKAFIDPVDYFLIYILIEVNKDRISKALLNLETVLSIESEHLIAYLLYNFIKAGDNCYEMDHFIEAAYLYYQHNKKLSPQLDLYFRMLSKIYEVINADKEIDTYDFEELLSYFNSNEVSLYRFIKRLSYKYSSQNILSLVKLSRKKNPLESKLKILELMMLYELKEYDKAYEMIVDIEELLINIDRDDLIRTLFIKGDLLKIKNQKGLALLEFKSLVENDLYKGTLSDDYFLACFELIRFYNEMGEYQNSESIFNGILNKDEDILVDVFRYDYCILKAQMYMGLDDYEKAKHYQEMATKNKTDNGSHEN